jgi:hypothetical protein
MLWRPSPSALRSLAWPLLVSRRSCRLGGGAELTARSGLLRGDAGGSPRPEFRLLDGEGTPGDWGHAIGVGLLVRRAARSRVALLPYREESSRAERLAHLAVVSTLTPLQQCQLRRATPPGTPTSTGTWSGHSSRWHRPLPPSSRRRGAMPVVPRDVGPVICVLRGRPRRSTR